MKTLLFVLLLGAGGFAACGDGSSMDQQTPETGVMGSDPMASVDNAIASGTPMAAMTPTMGMMGMMGM